LLKTASDLKLQVATVNITVQSSISKFVVGYSLLNPWSRVVLEKLIVTQLVKEFRTFMEPEVSLPCSHEPTTRPYPDETSPHLHALFL